MFTLTVVDADKLYFSSDSHFGHFNICKYCHRPFESRSQMDSDLIAKWNRDNISFVNLTDRVFYTLVECYNANERLINCQRIGIIDELPSEISTKLYPFNSYRFEL